MELEIRYSVDEIPCEKCQQPVNVVPEPYGDFKCTNYGRHCDHHGVVYWAEGELTCPHCGYVMWLLV